MSEKLYDLLLLFFLYAGLGWGCEVAFAACKQGRFVNRGFLNGPICPIYGVGVIGVVLALSPVKNSLILLYLGSVVLTSLIEFLTGFAMERIFRARWWDYSKMPLNIMGYVCMPFSMVWGAACMVIVLWLHPLFADGVRRLPDWLCIALDGMFAVVFVVDLCATLTAVRKLSERLGRLSELGSELHALSDELGQTITDSTLAARERVADGAEAVQARRAEVQRRLESSEARIADWLEQQRSQANDRTEAVRARFEDLRERMARVVQERAFAHRRILNAFPNLRSARHQEAVEALRAFYERRRRDGKAPDSRGGHSAMP